MPTLADPREETFLNWLLTPESERTPRTKKELAEQIGVHPSTLTTWRRNYHFAAEYDRRWRELAGDGEKAEAVVNKLHEKALNGDVRSMDLWLKWRGEFHKAESGSSEDFDDLRELSDDDLIRLLQQTPA